MKNIINIENKERFYDLVLDRIWQNGDKTVFINNKGEIIIVPTEGNMRVRDYNRSRELYDILEIKGIYRNIIKSENFKNVNTLDELVEYCSVLKEKREARKEDEETEKELFSDICDKVTKPKIDIRKEINNKKAKTFDFISVEIPICISNHKEALQYCKNNLYKLADYAIYKLNRSKRYTSYGVPTTVGWSYCSA